MDDVRYNFATINRLEAEALGRPGQRTFRLIVGDEQGEAGHTIWIEKEANSRRSAMRLIALLAHIGQRHLKRLDVTPPPPQPAAPLLDAPTVEFRIGTLALGYEAEQRLCLLQAHDIEGVDQRSSTVLLLIPPTIRRLSRQSPGSSPPGGHAARCAANP